MLPAKVNVFDQEIQQMDLYKNDYVDQMMNLLVDELGDFRKKNKPIELDLMHNVHYLQNVHVILSQSHLESLHWSLRLL
jgi:uncharacterized protein (UPF0305 family)